MKTAISYCRQSIKVKGMTDEESVMYQQQEIQRYAGIHNLKVVKSFNDVGYLGRSSNRPELQEMLAVIKKTPVNYLLVYSIDRFGRDYINHMNMVMKILTYVEHIVFVTDRLSSDSKDFMLMFNCHKKLIHRS